MKNLILSIVLLQLISGCNNKQDSEETDRADTPISHTYIEDNSKTSNQDTSKHLNEHDRYYNQPLVRKFLDKALDNGDTLAYAEVYNYHFERYMKGSFLYYAMEMANRNQYPNAFFDVYFILTNPDDGKTLNELDVDTRNMALYYLLKSSEMGYERAMDEAKAVFKDKAIPKSTFYKRNGDK